MIMEITERIAAKKAEPKRKAFDGLLPGKLLSEYDPSEPSAFDKLQTLLNQDERCKKTN